MDEIERADKLDAGQYAIDKAFGDALSTGQDSRAALAFRAFHPTHAELANRLARAVTDQATPVGSCTVARTKRILVEQQADHADRRAALWRGCLEAGVSQ